MYDSDTDAELLRLTARGETNVMNVQRRGPKEGIDLDAALAVLGKRLAERIDQVERWRQVRRSVGTAVLVLSVLASGSVAAAALLARDAVQSPPPVAYAEALTVRCVEAPDATAPAYFTVRYRLETGSASTASASAGSPGAVRT